MTKFLDLSAGAQMRLLALHERNALLHQGLEAEHFDATTGQQLTDAWRAQAPFDTEDYFARRLQRSGPTEERFRHAASLSKFASADVLPGVAQRAPAIFATESAGDCARARRHGFDFLTAVAPILARADDELAAQLAAAYPLPEERLHVDSVLESLSRSLHSAIDSLMRRTMILELNVARLQGWLQGNTSEERYSSYIELLSDPDYRTQLFDEYPVLLRTVHERVGTWVSTSSELLQRAAQDFPEFERLLGRPPARLLEVRTEMGDTHNGGRTVAILVFADGNKVV